MLRSRHYIYCKCRTVSAGIEPTARKLAHICRTYTCHFTSQNVTISYRCVFMLRQYIKAAGAQGASFPFIPCHVILLIYLSCLYPACYRALYPCCLSAVRQMLQALTLLRLFHLSVRPKMVQCPVRLNMHRLRHLPHTQV